MSDDEQPTFESGDAGGSLTYPQQASASRKGSFLMIKDRATKIIEMTISKTGKHGHAKCKFTAIDIFDGSKHEMLESSTHNVTIPNVTRAEFMLIDIADGALSLMDNESGDIREDLDLPKDQDLADKIEATFAADQESGKDTMCTVLKAIGKEQIIDVKSVNN